MIKNARDRETVVVTSLNVPNWKSSALVGVLTNWPSPAGVALLLDPLLMILFSSSPVGMQIMNKTPAILAAEEIMQIHRFSPKTLTTRIHSFNGGIPIVFRSYCWCLFRVLLSPEQPR